MPLAGSELHGNLYFFMFCKPGSFFINALSLTNTLYSGMKNKLSLGFSDTKKIEKNRPCSYRPWPLFRHSSHSLLFHFCIFLKTQGECFVSWIQKTFCDTFPVYLLLFQHRRERAEYIGTGDEKDHFDIVMQTSSNNLGLPVFKSTFRRVMPFLVFLGRGQNVLLCFLMDLTSPTTGINNEWSLNDTFFSWESLNN